MRIFFLRDEILSHKGIEDLQRLSFLMGATVFFKQVLRCYVFSRFIFERRNESVLVTVESYMRIEMSGQFSVLF